MHVPIGVSGVQAVPNTLHSHGLMTPLSTSPHWHAFGSATRTLGIEYRSSASKVANSGRSFSALCEMKPSPRHSKWGRSSKTSASTCEGARVAFVANDTRVLVLDLAPALADLREEHDDRLQDVERLEPGRHQAACRTARARTGRAGCPTTVETWPGPEEAVEAQIGRLEDRLDRRDDRDVVAEHAEVRDAALTRLQERDRGRRRGRLEPDGEEHHVAVGCLDGDPQRVERRVDEAHVGAARLRLEQVPVARPGTRIMSPNDVKITPGVSATAMASSTRPIGITHTGQPGPCTSSTFVGRTCSMPWR